MDETEEIQLAAIPADTAIYNTRGLFKLVFMNQQTITRNQGILFRQQHEVLMSLDPLRSDIESLRGDVNAARDTLGTLVTAAQTQIQQTAALQALVEQLQAGNVSQADIDALRAAVGDIRSTAQEMATTATGATTNLGADDAPANGPSNPPQ